MTDMKRKITMRLIYTIAIILLLGFSGYIYINLKTDFVSFDANYPIYHSAEELENDSDLIVIGSPKSMRNYVLKDEIGIVEEGYTVTDFEIDNIISQRMDENITKKISVLEPYFDYELSLKQKLVLQVGTQIIKTEEYEPMIKNNQYLLFLRYVSEEDKYVINGIFQGKYHISGDILTYHEQSEEEDHKHYK